MISTSDGKIYRWIVCACGKQNSAGICEHVKNPIRIERVEPPKITRVAQKRW
jgi:hypothetical protein